MELNLGSILGDIMRPEMPRTPKWLKEYGYCPVMRGEELWWRTREFWMIGVPPEGIKPNHGHAHILAADYGPTGVPLQVRGSETVQADFIQMRDVHGDPHGMITVRTYSYINAVAGVLTRGAAPRYFYYTPKDENNPLNVFAAFLPYSGYDENDHPISGQKLFALVAPITSNIHHWLSPEGVDALPVMSGIEDVELESY